MDGSSKNKELWSYVLSFECSRPKVAHSFIHPSIHSLIYSFAFLTPQVIMSKQRPPLKRRDTSLSIVPGEAAEDGDFVRLREIRQVGVA